MNKSKKSRLFVIVLLAISLIAPILPMGMTDGESWLSGWSYRKSHIINGTTAGAQTDYQMKIIVHYGAGSDSEDDVYLNSKCRTDFGDIRFTNSSGEDLLDYWIEEKTDSDNATIWVEVDNIPSSPNNVNIYIYYGKADATTISSGTNTFLDFDDFSYAGESPTDHGWTEFEGIGTYSYSIEGGRLKMEADYNDRSGLYNDISTSDGAMDVDVEVTSSLYPGFYSGAIVGVRKGTYLYQLALGDPDHGDGRLRYSADWSTIYILSFASELNTVYAVSQRFVGSNLSTVIDEVDEGSGTDANLDSGFCFLYVHSGIVYYDNFRIRKYVDPEPANGDWGSEESIPPPSDPNLLFGAGFNASSPYVELHWNHSLADVQFFEVQNSSDAESWTYLGQSTTANYTDTQVVNGTERYYKVRACNQTEGTWYNSSFSDVNFEKVYFIPGDGIPPVEDYSILFLAIGLILMLAIAFLYTRDK